MESRFDRLVQKDSYQAKTLYHGTTASAAASINKEGISLYRCRSCTDFNGKCGFYVTADYDQAYKWAKNQAKKKGCSPEVVKFDVDRQELEQRFCCKRFEEGEYNDWLIFTYSSRRGIDNKHDIVEGPYKSKDNNGNFIKPQGHQLGIFSSDVAKYFDKHNVTSSSQLSLAMERLSLW